MAKALAISGQHASRFRDAARPFKFKIVDKTHSVLLTLSNKMLRFFWAKTLPS
jgi:hypothetical protein